MIGKYNIKTILKIIIIIIKTMGIIIMIDHNINLDILVIKDLQ